MQFKIIRETRKALQLEAENVTFWIQRRWQRDDGSLTPRGIAAFDEAKKNGGSHSNKTAYVRCKYSQLEKISEKAVKVTCFDGSSDILPVSQIVDDWATESLLVPCWLADKKNLQFANKKIWRDK